VAQPLVLAIEPDLRQAAIVKRLFKDKALADVAVVDSRDAAIEAMRTLMPDVLLLSALMSPRDEDELMAHLRTLDNAGHLQTHTLPQLASALGSGEERASRGLFSAFRRKKEVEPVASGCDPDLFAEEIRVFLQQAAEKKRELQDTPRPAFEVRAESSRQAADLHAKAKESEAAAAPAGATAAWSSPFEWKPSGERGAPQPLRDEVGDMTFVQPIVIPTAAPATPPPVARAVVAPERPAARIVIAQEQPAPQVERPQIEVPHVVPEPEPVFQPEPLAAAAEVAAPVIPVAIEPEPEPAVVARVEEEVASAVSMTPEPVAHHEPVRARAEKIVALVQEQAATLDQVLAPVQKNDEWTSNARDAKINDRLGSVARWARQEARGKSKPAPVTADDIRALIGSLSVPPAVASVTYARGCRIRRVRVPAATNSKRSDSVGAVILSRRALAEQRERRPSA